MSARSTATTVRIVNPGPYEGLAFIEADDGTETRVRFGERHGRWRCGEHGNALDPCPHAALVAAALELER